MSKLKDKLSANMRNVKAHQQAPGAKTPEHAAATHPEKHPQKPAAQRRPVSKAQDASSTGDVPPSENALFPSRVWPD